ncbi:DUF6638 family protein [Thalassospira xianhensis]|uniref:Uncharacterized protein n=1 Tax=Thalassospira xianhensis MCCC 1A02616 TaxID=1177929 RepID=A0A367UHE6_9PROT|nr:DUF6638 family protein [Thalassospira xianhensis]RCK07726.1 hypothetical protein TH5_01270 [Thalassospira xianhensis MCCC 1A02616]
MSELSSAVMGSIENLMLVQREHLISRYSNAMEALGLPRTRLSSFHIDATGFSPEIAEELGNRQYLNAFGVNRKYILLAIEQQNLAVLDAHFTTTPWMMREFISLNEKALFNLTAKDAVFGELDNKTYRIDSLDDLLSMKTVTFSVHTPSGLVDGAARLKTLATDVRESSESWNDEAKLLEMVKLAKKLGDVESNDCLPEHVVFDKGNFYSRHLGGLYLFDVKDGIALIHEDPNFNCPATWKGKTLYPIDMRDKDALMQFLVNYDFIEIPNMDFLQKNKAALQTRLEGLLFAHLAEAKPNMDLSGFTFAANKHHIYEQFSFLPKAFHTLNSMLKHIDNGVSWEDDTMGATCLAYTTNAMPGRDNALVNHLLSRLTPADYVRCYHYNPDLFQERFGELPPSGKEYVLSVVVKKYETVDHDTGEIVVKGVSEESDTRTSSVTKGLIGLLRPW